jgi:hypothetical protein
VQRWSVCTRVHDATTQKIVVLILAAVRTWNLTKYSVLIYQAELKINNQRYLPSKTVGNYGAFQSGTVITINTMKQSSSWEADSRPASQEIWPFIWNRKVTCSQRPPHFYMRYGKTKCCEWKCWGWTSSWSFCVLCLWTVLREECIAETAWFLSNNCGQFATDMKRRHSCESKQNKATCALCWSFPRTAVFRAAESDEILPLCCSKREWKFTRFLAT